MILSQYLFLLIPLGFVPLIAKFMFPHRITLMEWVITTVATSAVFCIVMALAVESNLSNTEVLNGKVLSKFRDRVSCEHSYQSCSGSGDDRTCTTKYEHSFDYDWVARTSVGDVKIDRIDRQGRREPTRYSNIVIGESASVESRYKDYLKASPDSLFNFDPSTLEQYSSSVPKYPKVYDYYRFNRFVFLGDRFGEYDVRHWNAKLNVRLEDLSKKIQGNIIVAMSNGEPMLFDALQYHWNGGKKNDVILGVGVNEGGYVKWFNSTSFMNGFGNSVMHANLRMDALDKELNYDLINSLVDRIEADFKRHSMSDEIAMLDAYTPPWWVFFLSIGAGLLTAVGASYKFANNHNQVSWNNPDWVVKLKRKFNN